MVMIQKVPWTFNLSYLLTPPWVTYCSDTVWCSIYRPATVPFYLCTSSCLVWHTLPTNFKFAWHSRYAHIALDSDQCLPTNSLSLIKTDILSIEQRVVVIVLVFLYCTVCCWIWNLSKWWCFWSSPSSFQSPSLRCLYFRTVCLLL